MISAAAELWQIAGLTRPWNDPIDDLRRAMEGPASTVLAGIQDGVLFARSTTQRSTRRSRRPSGGSDYLNPGGVLLAAGVEASLRAAGLRKPMPADRLTSGLLRRRSRSQLSLQLGRRSCSSALDRAGEEDLNGLGVVEMTHTSCEAQGLGGLLI
jgi:hypothetical protein